MNNAPIFVDLDGTLIRNDLLQEGIIKTIKQNLIFLVFIFFWLCKGKCYLKKKIAQFAKLDTSILIYNQSLLQWLREQKEKGHRLILLTASLQNYAELVNEHLNIFDQVHGTQDINLKGKKKLQFINNLIGESEFIYLGNNQADLPLWRSAKEAICVNTSSAVLKKAKKTSNVTAIFKDNHNKMVVWLKALRIHQYAKNSLIFLPLILGQCFSWTVISETIIGFVCFSLLASSAYIINDLLDLENDRSHPSKCERPFAAGLLPLHHGIIVALLLLIAAAIVSSFLNWHFQLILLFYYITTLVYSLWFKSLLLLDVFSLSVLYTIRILAGMTLIPSPDPIWLLMFSIFFFYSLALVKRYTELWNKLKHEPAKLNGRSYNTDHLSIIQNIGSSSGMLACMIFALYLSSTKAATMYAHPLFLYGVCIVLLFWISRIWFLTVQGHMEDDPVLFAIKDKSSYLMMAVIVIIMIIAAL